MLDNEPDQPTPNSDQPATDQPVAPAGDEKAPPAPRRRRAASRPAGPPATAPDAPAIQSVDTSAVADSSGISETALPAKKTARKVAAKRQPKKAAEAAGDQTPAPTLPGVTDASLTDTASAAPEPVAAEAPPAKTRRPRKSAVKASAETTPGSARDDAPGTSQPPTAETSATGTPDDEASAGRQSAKRSPRKRVAKVAAAAAEESADDVLSEVAVALAALAETRSEQPGSPEEVGEKVALTPEEIPTDGTDVSMTTEEVSTEEAPTPNEETQGDSEPAQDESQSAQDDTEGDAPRRRRRRGGRRRRRSGGDEDSTDSDSSDSDDESNDSTSAGRGPDDSTSTKKSDRVIDDKDATDSPDSSHPGESGADDSDPDGDGQRRRRRRRRRRGEDAGSSPDDPSEVVVRVREPRGERSSGGKQKKNSNEVTGIDGSTRMEAKRQRRREGREAGRRRTPILSEAEFLARREAVVRKMIIRQRDDLAQIAVLEDGILVEHYVDRDSAASLIGNVYLGRVQNVLPSMEAAFIDIGRGRNAVLYAGEVNWDSFGAEGQGRKVEKVLKSGQPILVQVTKDPVGAKGARLTNHVSIPGRYVVYAPGGHLSGISRKLPDVERRRLKDILADLVGDSASVVVRTAAEGASEEELVRDVNRLKAQWADIERKITAGQAPQLLYGEPDLTVRIVRDLFTEDFSELIIQPNAGVNDAYEAVEGYVTHVAPHLADRLRRWDGDDGRDLFGEYRLDEQIAKALEQKVFLPSGGSLIIEKTEAMTVIDVNTGKFTGAGGNLEATVTSNNLEAAEEIVRQLRLRDVGGIIVIDFIDMVLPSNRELLLRRLVECLGRDRTRHQVAEVTSLGLVQMTRKKIGTGLLEAFSTECPHCHGRGVELHDVPVESQRQADGGAREPRPRDRRGAGGAGSGSNSGGAGNGNGANNGGSGRNDHPAETPTEATSEATTEAPTSTQSDARTDQPQPEPSTSSDKSSRSRRGGRNRRGGGSSNGNEDQGDAEVAGERTTEASSDQSSSTSEPALVE